MHALVLAVPDRLQRQVDPEWNGFVYVCDGAGSVSGVKATREQVREGSCTPSFQYTPLHCLMLGG